MIYHFSFYLKCYWPFFNIVHYVSVRAVASLLSSLGMFLVCGSYFLRFSQRFFRSKARESTPDAHKKKDSMPTMGGIFILAIVIINSLLWCDISRFSLWIFLFCMCGFCAIGFWDYWNKILHNRGISAG